MPITIGSNIASLSAMRQLNTASQKSSSTFERLSSGQRIVRASDDAAGLAIANTLNSRQRVLTQGARNISDGQSFLAVTEGALQALNDMTIRMRELASQAANGAVSRTQRLALQAESDKLTEEFARVVASTQFNGINVLDGNTTSLRIQAGYGISGGLDTALTQGLRRAQGTGSFGSSSSAGTTGTDTLVVDLNGDGNNDIVSTNTANPTLYYHLGDGTGAIGAQNTVTSTAVTVNNSTLAAGDIDGDGDTDIVAMGINSGASRTYLTTYINNGGALSVSSQIFATSSTTSGLKLADINSDGRADALFFASTLSGAPSYSPGILAAFGQSNGTLAPIGSASAFASGSSISFDVGDYTGDGKVDIVYAASPSATILKGNGSGVFSGGQTIAGVSYTQGLNAGDFNRDGLRDFAYTELGLDDGGDPIFIAKTALSRGDGTFTAISSGGNTTTTDVADMNGDGFLDQVSTNLGFVNTYLGNGDGTFGSYTNYNISRTATSFGDLNNDGVADAVSSASSVARWLQSTTNTTTAKYVTLATAQDARDALSTIDATLQRISTELGNVGAAMSRLSTMFQTVAAERENSVAAASRIMDVDVASESSSLIRNRISQQAAQAVLAQANLMPELALKLLQR